MDDDYLAINRANWDSRVPLHEQGYGLERYDDPAALSDVVAFDLPRLGSLAGLDVVHLQCHLGTDTLSLARLGAASVTGVDLSPASLDAARRLAARAGADISYVESDVFAAPAVLGESRFDLVYTGIGALCWLPSIARWAHTVAQLLRPGGRLFVRDAHPVLLAAAAQEVGAEHPDRGQMPSITPPGGTTVALELPYFEQIEPLRWSDEVSYAGDGVVGSPLSLEWNHGIGEIVTAVLDAGLALTGLVEHDSVPWEALPGMIEDAAGEFRLADRPERLPASFTLTSTKPA